MSRFEGISVVRRDSEPQSLSQRLKASDLEQPSSLRHFRYLDVDSDALLDVPPVGFAVPTRGARVM